MNALAQRRPEVIARHEGIEEVEAHLFSLPQVDCPIVHHFGPGIYIREVHLPAGTFAIGHKHKTAHTNVLFQGQVAIVNNDRVDVVQAPAIFTAQPGRKAVAAITDCVWLNIFATDETDIEKLEDQLIEKSDTYQECEKELREMRIISAEVDRHDFAQFLTEFGLTAEQARAIAENTDDQIPMPDGWSGFTLRPSYIEGRGVFASRNYAKDEPIGPARVGDKRTPLGRFTNHSLDPNALFKRSQNGDIYLVAGRAIRGCEGGDYGEEITVDYRQAAKVRDAK